MDDPKIGCVVVSLRTGRDTLLLHTSDGLVEIKTEPISGVRSRVVVRAPIAVNIKRKRTEEAHDAV